MIDSPIILTEQEQLQIQELDNQIRLFSEFKNTTLRCLCSGADSITIARLIQFLDQMIAQSSNNSNQIKTNAKSRNSKKETTDAI